MSESQAKRVRIKEVDGWTLKMLIDYVYTAEVQVTEENVQVSGRILSTHPIMVCMMTQKARRLFSCGGHALIFSILVIGWICAFS